MKREPLIWTSQELFDYDFGTTTYIVDPLLPAKGIGLFWGKGGAGKSLLANTLIRNALDGTRFLGKYRVHAPKIAYLGVDMPESEVQKRIRKSFPDKPKNVLWLLSQGPINIQETKDTDEWVLQLCEFAPDLLIIDTLRKVHILDENASQSVTTVYGAFRWLFKDSALLFLHHVPKALTMGTRPNDETFTGSKAWSDNADWGCWVQGVENPFAKVVDISIPRYRYVDHPSGAVMKLNEETMLLEVRENTRGGESE